MNKKINKTKLRALNFCAPYFWKKLYLYVKCPVLKSAEKFVYSRSSVVPSSLVNYEVKIHSGKLWHKRFLNKWMVGFKFGEFTWNRRVALYKAKQLKKKKKTKK